MACVLLSPSAYGISWLQQRAVANERQGLSRALMATVYPSLGFRPSPLSAWTLMLMLQLSDAAG